MAKKKVKNYDFNTILTEDELRDIVKTHLMMYPGVLIDLKTRYNLPKYFIYITSILSLVGYDCIAYRFETLPINVRTNLLNLINHDYYLL